MGKGNGNHHPQKFITDQWLCQIVIFLFSGASITLSSLSVGMDDGGSFPYQYFFTGFILGPILLVNLISRVYVVRTVQKKGVTRKNIIDILNNTKFGKHIWPWSCKVGMLWCIPGCLLTGLGGVNCGIEEKQEGDDPANVTRTVRNSCYFDIEGDRGEMYKGLAIGLVVVHVFSFVYLLLSNCPVLSVLDQIKEDPGTNATARANARPPVAAAPPPAVKTVKASATGRRGNEMEMKAKVKKLEARVKQLEGMSEVRGISVLPPPPSYSELQIDPSDKNSGALPDTSFP